MTCHSSIDPATAAAHFAVDRRGHAPLTNPLTDRGTASPPAERERLGLEGLVPPAVWTMTLLERESATTKPIALERCVHPAALPRARWPESRPLRYEPSPQRDAPLAAAVCEH